LPTIVVVRIVGQDGKAHREGSGLPKEFSSFWFSLRNH